MKNCKRILLVDDDTNVRALISAMLTPEGFEIIEAAEIEIAISKLSEDKPFDLVVLDFWLGESHAVPIMDVIRTSGLGVPIIMISGGNRRMDLETTEAISDISGAVVFLQKPFQKSVLLETVRLALS